MDDEEVWGIKGGDGSITYCECECHRVVYLCIIKMVNIMLCIFCHSLKKKTKPLGKIKRNRGGY